MCGCVCCTRLPIVNLFYSSIVFFCFCFFLLRITFPRSQFSSFGKSNDSVKEGSASVCTHIIVFFCHRTHIIGLNTCMWDAWLLHFCCIKLDFLSTKPTKKENTEFDSEYSWMECDVVTRNYTHLIQTRLLVCVRTRMTRASKMSPRTYTDTHTRLATWKRPWVEKIKWNALRTNSNENWNENSHYWKTWNERPTAATLISHDRNNSSPKSFSLCVYHSSSIVWLCHWPFESI